MRREAKTGRPASLWDLYVDAHGRVVAEFTDGLGRVDRYVIGRPQITVFVFRDGAVKISVLEEASDEQDHAHA